MKLVEDIHPIAETERDCNQCLTSSMIFTRRWALALIFRCPNHLYRDNTFMVIAVPPVKGSIVNAIVDTKLFQAKAFALLPI